MTRGSMTITIFFLQSQRIELDYNGIVEDLFIPNTRTWDVELIQELFIPDDVAHIVSTMSCRYTQEDKLIWHFSPDGNAYRLAIMLTVDDGLEDDVVWKDYGTFKFHRK